MSKQERRALDRHFSGQARHQSAAKDDELGAFPFFYSQEPRNHFDQLLRKGLDHAVGKHNAAHIFAAEKPVKFLLGDFGCRLVEWIEAGCPRVLAQIIADFPERRPAGLVANPVVAFANFEIVRVDAYAVQFHGAVLDCYAAGFRQGQVPVSAGCFTRWKSLKRACREMRGRHSG